jgi:hypothetical protein
MEELDKLKMDWKKNEGNYPRFSDNDIYKMLHKKSSSIVKWILIISILEFLLFLSLTVILNANAGTKRVEDYLSAQALIAITVADYVIMAYFFYKFYLNYRKISTTDRVKNLMVNILKTRKTVSNYIMVKLFYIVVLFVVISIAMFNNDPEAVDLLNRSEANGSMVQFYLLLFVLEIIGLGVLIFLFWLFYKLIYGFLLKRLYRNYEELKKIDF